MRIEQNARDFYSGFQIDKPPAQELTWVCPKCGLPRSNKKQHIHGKV